MMSPTASLYLPPCPKISSGRGTAVGRTWRKPPLSNCWWSSTRASRTLSFRCGLKASLLLSSNVSREPQKGIAKMSTQDEVRQACDQYYAALNHKLNGDAGLMMEVWSHSADVTVMH